MIEAIGGILVGLGLVFLAIGSLGILRFEDVYLRLQVSSKSVTFGMGFLLLGAGLISGDALALGKSVVAVMFLYLTSPIAAHMIARSAMRGGIEPVKVEATEGSKHGDEA